MSAADEKQHAEALKIVLEDDGLMGNPFKCTSNILIPKEMGNYLRSY